MRTLIADAVIFMTSGFLRWVDPTVVDLHAVRREGFFANIPLVTDPCIPRATVRITNGYGYDKKRV